MIKNQLHRPANLDFFVQIRWLRLVKEEPIRSYERPTLGDKESIKQVCKFGLFCANKMAQINKRRAFTKLRKAKIG